MSRKPDIHRVLSRYADLNPPLGYPGGSCHLQERIRESPARNTDALIERHQSGRDSKPDFRAESAIYPRMLDEGPVRGTSFGRVLISEHAQYRMDQKGITVPVIHRILREFQKDWVKERNQFGDTGGHLLRMMRQSNEFQYQHKGYVLFMRPLKHWKKGQKLDVHIRTVFDQRTPTPEPVPEEVCQPFKGWSKDYPEHGLDRILPKRKSADLSPPLGYPGGSCHVLHRIHDEVGNPRVRDSLVDTVEDGKSLSNAQAHKVYKVDTERGPKGRLFSKLLLTAHVQYRMDQRGITVSEVRLALQEFVKELHRQRSMQSPQARLWEDSMSWGDEIKWTSRIGLTIVFTASRDTVTLITAYWKGLSDPRPKDEEDCGIFPSPKSAAGMGDCYEANGKFFMNSVTPFLGGSSKSMRLVHGEVTGQGSLDGVNYGHAWVEDGNTVIDKSNGKNLRMPKAAYYALGNIDQNDNLHKYTPEEFRRKVLKHEHWGPWDLRTSTGL